MPFSKKVKAAAFIKCGRHCCICGKFAGKNMECHHIVQEADGGDNSEENCIPLCLDCHADVKSFNPHHPKGSSFTPSELRGHRDKCYAKYSTIATSLVAVDAVETTIDWFDIHSKPNEANVSWGYGYIDLACKIKPGSLIMINGDSGVGKSIFAQNVMMHNLRKKHNVVYFNLKESSESVLDRIFSAESIVKFSDIQNNKLTAEEWQRLSTAIGVLNVNCLKFISYNHNSKLSEQLLSVVNRKDVDLVIIDDFAGLGLKENEIENFMYRLKATANSSKTTIMLLCRTITQLNSSNISIKLNTIQSFCDVVQTIQQKTLYEYSDSHDKLIEISIVKNLLSGQLECIELILKYDFFKMVSFERQSSDEKVHKLTNDNDYNEFLSDILNG